MEKPRTIGVFHLFTGQTGEKTSFSYFCHLRIYTDGQDIGNRLWKEEGWTGSDRHDRDYCIRTGNGACAGYLGLP